MQSKYFLVPTTPMEISRLLSPEEKSVKTISRMLIFKITFVVLSTFFGFAMIFSLNKSNFNNLTIVDSKYRDFTFEPFSNESPEFSAISREGSVKD